MLRLLFLIVTLGAGAGHGAAWSMLPETEVEVDVPWRGLTVVMRFPDVAGTIEFDERRPETAHARIAVATTTVRTGLPPADRLAKSADFLAAEEFPSIGFTLERLEQTSRSTADIFGQIAFRGVTRPIEFKATVFRYGAAEDDPERFEAGFRLEGSIDRTKFGSVGALREVPAVLPIRIDLFIKSD